MAVVMEKRIVITLQDIQGLAFQCRYCQATLKVIEQFSGLQFQVAQPNIHTCPACRKSWIVDRNTREALNQEVFDNANKLLEALDYFREKADDSIPWGILLELPGEPSRETPQ